MSPYVGMDEREVLDVLHALSRVRNETDGVARGVVKLLAEASGYTTDRTGLAPRQLSAFAAWCTQTKSDLERRLGYLHPVDGQPRLFPSDSPFRTVAEARQAGTRDGRAIAKAIDDYQAGRITRVELAARVARIRGNVVDANYAGALFGEVEPRLLGRLAAQNASYDANHDEILDRTEAAAFNKDFGPLYTALAVAEAGGTLPADYRDEVLSLPSDQLAAVMTVAPMSALFLVDAARRVLTPRRGQTATEPVVRARVQALAAVSRDARASRMVLADGKLLYIGFDLARRDAPYGRDFATRADAVMAAVVRAGLAPRAGTPEQVRAAWRSVVGAINKYPYLARCDGKPRPRLTNYAIVEAFAAYLPAVSYDSIDSKIRRRYGIADPGEPRLGIGRGATVTFLSNLIVDTRSSELLTKEAAVYAARLRLTDMFYARRVQSGIEIGHRDDFFDRLELLKSALTLVADTAERAYETARRRADFSEKTLEATISVLLLFIKLPDINLVIDAVLDLVVDQAKSEALTRAKRIFHGHLPADGTVVLSTLVNAVADAYVDQLDTTGLSGEEIAAAKAALAAEIKGALFEPLARLVRQRLRLENN